MSGCARMPLVCSCARMPILYCQVGGVGVGGLVPDIDTSGSPCQDWSSAGHRRGLHGPSGPLLLAWIRWHRSQQTALIVHENVVGFDVSIFVRYLGDMYHVTSTVADPADVGWECCRRPRIYVALFHKEKIQLRPDECEPSANSAGPSRAQCHASQRCLYRWASDPHHCIGVDKGSRVLIVGPHLAGTMLASCTMLCVGRCGLRGRASCGCRTC